MSRPGLLVAVAGGVVGAAVLGTWWFLRDTSGTGGAPVAEPLPEASRPAPEAPSPAPEVERTSTAVEAVPAAEAPMPPSYRDALCAVTGRIVEHDRTPIAELPVSLVAVQPMDWLVEPAALLGTGHSLPALEAAESQTGEDGRFLLAGVEPRAVHVLGIDLGGPRSTFRILPQTPRTGETLDIGDVVLEPQVTLVGRVLDPEGRPAAGARVRATEVPPLVFQVGVQDLRPGTDVLLVEDDRPQLFEIPLSFWAFERFLPFPTTHTAEDGTFRLPGVVPGLVSLVADRAHFLAGVKNGVPTGKQPERNVGDLYLAAGQTVGGKVTDERSQPLAGVEVKVGVRLNTMPAPMVWMHATPGTDAGGDFAADGLNAGSEAWVATRLQPGHPFQVHGPFQVPGAPIVIALATRQDALVHVHDLEGAPVEDVTLYLSPRSVIPDMLPVFAPPMQRVTEVETVAPGTLRLRGLVPGEYSLVGEAPGYALAEAELDVTAEENRAELQFAPGHFLDVTVLNAATEEPLEWCFVTIGPARKLERPVDRGRTDARGHVRLTGLVEGSYTVTAQHPALASRIVELEVPAAEPLEIHLIGGGSLRGRVHRGGTPPEESLWILSYPKSEWIPSTVPTFAATSSTGDFLLANLEPGDYELEVRDQLSGKSPVALFMSMQDDPLAEREFSLEEGETTELDIDLLGGEDGPTARLTGEVWINGAPGSELSVQWAGRRTRSTETDANGVFDLGLVSAGEGRLRVRNLKGKSGMMGMASSIEERKLDLLPGSSRHEIVTLTVSRVYGRVMGPGVLPASAGTFVILGSRSEEGDQQMVETTDLLGGYEFSQVPVGTYELTVYRQGAANHRQTITVEAREALEVDVRLQNSVTLSGVVTMPPGWSSPGPEGEGDEWHVWLMTEEGAYGGGGMVHPLTLEYVVEEATPGRYRMQANCAGAMLTSEYFEVPAEGPVRRDLALAFAQEEVEAEILADD